jgi:hypothetical protein
MEEIRSEAVDAFRSLPHGGMEIGGVLLGVERSGAVRITARMPVACEHALGPGFVLSPNEEAALAQLLGGTDPRLAGLRPVGWYRSRTRGDASLPERDRKLHARYFPEPWQVLLVLRPEASAVAKAVFFARTAESELAAGEEFVLAPVVRNSAPRRVPALEVTAPLKPVSPAEIPVSRERARTAPSRPADGRWLAVSFALLMLLFATAGFIDGHRPAPAGPPALGLLALDVKGQLRITWDRNSQPARESSRAVMEIADGGNITALHLDHASIVQGSVAYVRRSSRVDVQMRVFRGRTEVEERAVFLGTP